MKIVKRRGIFLLVILSVFIFLDQWTKYVAVMKLRSQPPFSIVPDICEFVYVENMGSAWGMLSGMRILLIVVSVILLCMILYLYFRMPDEKRYLPAQILLGILSSGAIGNLIDRIHLGYVIDFIYFSVIDFPVFNVADCYVTISLFLLILIYRKEIAAWMKNG